MAWPYKPLAAFDGAEVETENLYLYSVRLVAKTDCPADSTPKRT